MLMVEVFLLAYGKPFKQTMIDLGEESIKKAKVGADNYRPSIDLGLPSLGLILTMVSTLVFDLLYLSLAFGHDPLAYPTLSLLGLYVLSIIAAVIKGKIKPDLTTDSGIHKYRNKLKSGRSFISIASILIWIAYYVYMLYVLIV